MADSPTSPRPAAAGTPVRRASFMFEATLEDVSRVAQALQFFIPPSIPEESRIEMEIGVVEAMTNIVKHGYESCAAGVIEISYSFSDGLITIELRDQGKPISTEALLGSGDAAFDFDPEDIANLPESGMGMPLIRSTFDRIDYVHADGANVLRLIKHIPPAPPQ